MKPFNLRTLIVLLLFCLTATALFSQTGTEYSRLDTLMNLLSSHGKFMGTVAVNRDNKTVYTGAFGYADIENRIPATLNTRYRIGSVSKMFTSVMIFQLIDEKKLTLETRLSDFYPSVPNSAEISIRAMLLHRSGIWSVTDDSLYLVWDTAYRSHEQILGLIAAHPPLFKPDEKSAYSNSNFILLGYIVEKITGKDYATNLQERICRKADLESTAYGGPANISANGSYSYTMGTQGWIKDRETDMSIPGGAGAVVSTAGDLVKFADALFGGKLIQAESLAEMTTTEGTYAKGIFQMPFYDLKGYGHTGGIDGFRTVLMHFPAENLSLALCSNGLNYAQNDILIGLMSLLTGREYTMPQFREIQLSPEFLKQYEGVYSGPSFPLKLTIKLEGSILTAQATGQSSFPLEAESNTAFKFDPAGIKIIFDNGNQLTIKQNGMEFPMKRE